MDTGTPSAYILLPMKRWTENISLAGRRSLSLASVMLFLAGTHMVVLGSTHTHTISSELQVTSPHVCFLCQVSPNVDVDWDMVKVNRPPEPRRGLQGETDSVHTHVVAATLRSRAPPPSP